MSANAMTLTYLLTMVALIYMSKFFSVAEGIHLVEVINKNSSALCAKPHYMRISFDCMKTGLASKT